MTKSLSQSLSMQAAVVTVGLSVVLVTAWFSGIASATQANEGPVSGVLSVSPEIDTSWRYTKFGWQNASSWVSPKAYVPRQTLEQVHPLVWTGIVLISVIAMMIWASSEWDFARLLHGIERSGPESAERSESASLEQPVEAIETHTG